MSDEKKDPQGSGDSFAPRLGLYVHTCQFGDRKIIDETDVEFLKCLCFGWTPEVLKAKDDLSRALDLERGA